jgi:peptidoglycan biosynthesis protein MviN/MurJ (putative lipid II flippase)
VASANLVIKMAANYSLVPWLGMKGIVLATAFMYMASALLCWLAVRPTNKERNEIGSDIEQVLHEKKPFILR